MKSIREKKKWVEDYNTAKTLVEDLEVIYEFYKDKEATIEDVEMRFDKAQAVIEDIEFKNMLSDEGDNLSAVLQITAGAGGTESCDWASMLMRMYLMYAEKSGFKVKELNYQEGDVAGIKTVTLEIDGDHAFGWLHDSSRLKRKSTLCAGARREKWEKVLDVQVSNHVP